MKTKANSKNRNTLRSYFALGALAFLGCSPKPTIEMKIAEPAPIQKTDSEQVVNYSVTRVAVFGDDLAYGHHRGIYEITDNKTGKKYFGVSGIGIYEVGSHPAGKSTVQDER